LTFLLAPFLHRVTFGDTVTNSPKCHILIEWPLSNILITIIILLFHSNVSLVIRERETISRSLFSLNHIDIKSVWHLKANFVTVLKLLPYLLLLKKEMAALPNEIGENLLGTILNLNVTTKTGSKQSNNTLLNHLVDLNADDEFNDDAKYNPSDDQTHCKAILWQPVNEGSTVRTWDLLVLIPNVIFLIVLVI